MRFQNAYYVTYTFKDNPFFLGPYYILEQAETYYKINESEKDIQILKVQIAK